MHRGKAKLVAAALLIGGAALLSTANSARADEGPVGCGLVRSCTKGPQLCATVEAGLPPLVITYYCYEPQGDM